jgi:hypothetical protein
MFFKGVNVAATNGESGQVQITGVPDRCPRCHTAMAPTELAMSIAGSLRGGVFEQAYRCTSLACGRVFIGEYQWREDPQNIQCNQYYAFVRATPISPQPHKFSKEIEGVSPMFLKVFNQAAAAEAAGLDEIDGMGYRRALEFLLKDFLGQQHPDERDAICRMALQKCVQKYVDYPRLKTCAERAVWLGNDETHYERRWEDKVLEDLKTLIRLTVNWIESVLLTAHYEAAMPEGRST